MFARWLRSSRPFYRRSDLNENLALGWFRTGAPTDPLVESCCYIVHAALGHNGELWARAGNGCLRAFRGLKNVRLFYVVALRERGAVYYISGGQGVRGVAATPMMRPVAIDPFDECADLYAGVHQSALGQIGFRVDTRVHEIRIDRAPELSSRFGTAQFGDALTAPSDAAAHEVGDPWQVVCGRIVLGPAGAEAAGGGAQAIVALPARSGLLHAVFETGDRPGAAGLVWRHRDHANFWVLKITPEAALLIEVAEGSPEVVATDRLRRLRPNARHSVQILDAAGQVGCHLDGVLLFERWIAEPSMAGTGVGVWFGEEGDVRVRDFEAHACEVPMPERLRFEAPWRRLGKRAEIRETFDGAAADLAGRQPSQGTGRWERTLGNGMILTESGLGARVRADVATPNAGRTVYTLPWERPEFADVEVTVVPPGTGRGQQQRCRAGLVLWQNAENYLCFSVYLDDNYDGASIALFTKRYGFEELYDAIWTMVGDDISWGKPFQLRVACDCTDFVVYVNDQPVMERALTDIYPDDCPMRIDRVGLVVNWEWGDDTGSIFGHFVARF